MRLALFVLAASVALAGCGKEEATGNTSALDQAVTAEDFEANDVTAIDAATGADANMAADVDINLIGNENGASRPAAAGTPRPPRTAPPSNDAAPAAPPAQPADEPAAEPATAEPDDQG